MTPFARPNCGLLAASKRLGSFQNPVMSEQEELEVLRSHSELPWNHPEDALALV